MKHDPSSKIANTILGVGTDIIEIDRFRKAMDKYGQRFLDRLFSSKEQEHCERYSDPERRFAARFCAKEAAVKALGVGFGKHVRFLDVEVLNQESGRPILVLSPSVQEYFNYPEMFLSISHAKHYATALVVATCKAS